MSSENKPSNQLSGLNANVGSLKLKFALGVMLVPGKTAWIIPVFIKIYPLPENSTSCLFSRSEISPQGNLSLHTPVWRPGVPIAGNGQDLMTNLYSFAIHFVVE